MNPHIAFLQTEALLAIQPLQHDTPAKWGLMSPQHMVEHLADFIDLSTAKISFPLAVPEEHVPQYRAFLFSDKVFRENTKAPNGVMPDSPGPYRLASLDEAKLDFKRALDSFFSFFETDPLKTTLHPAFGHLNFDEWLILHDKHIRHHLRQFGLSD